MKEIQTKRIAGLVRVNSLVSFAVTLLTERLVYVRSVLIDHLRSNGNVRLFCSVRLLCKCREQVLPKVSAAVDIS